MDIPNQGFTEQQLASIHPLAKPKGRRRERRTETDKLSAEEMTDLSADSIKRNFPGFIVQLSERRQGITLRNILRIINGRKSVAA